MSAATTLSRVTGYARTMTQAAVLGTGAVANAYTFSNALPTQVHELFVGGLLSSVFVPLLVERLAAHGTGDARRLTNALLTLTLPFLAVVALLGVVFAEPLVDLATAWGPAEGFSGREAREATDLAVLLFRVFAFQILLYGVGALSTGVLNAHRRFLLPALAPVLNNLAVIASFASYAVLVPESPLTAVYVLAFGTTLGVAAMSLVMVPAVLGLGYRPGLVLRHPSLPAAFRLAGPVLVFVAASVGVAVVSNLFGSRFGGVEKLWYAFTVFQLPYGVFVVAITTAIVPELSEKSARGDASGYGDTLSFGLRMTAFVTVPATVLLVALAEPIVALLYERGSFAAEDTAEVSALLVAYGVGLLGYSFSFVLARSFYARQNALVPAVLNIGLLVLFVVLVSVLPRAFGLVGVALAFSGAYAALAVALLAAMFRRAKWANDRRLARSSASTLIAGVAAYGIASGGLYLTGTGDGLLGRSGVLVLVGGAACAAYLGIAFLLGSEEARRVAALARRKRTATAG